VNAGVTFRKNAQRLDENFVYTSWAGNRQMTDRAFARMRCDIGKMINLPQHLIRLVDDAASSLGQLHFTFGSLEQFYFEFFFKLPNLLAQRRLADMQAYRRPAKM
jgi:hypothetical protein